MDNEANYLGAAVFWLYIVAALFFTGQVIYTIVKLQPTKDTSREPTRKHVWIFGTLATFSFTTLSINMLNVLIQSFNSWSQGYQSLRPTDLLPSIWTWSVESTLFQDFAGALVENRARYLWSECALLMTFDVCLYMGSEGKRIVSITHRIHVDDGAVGHRREVPRLYAFFGLSQILPISFALNLFYVALLRLPQSPVQRQTSTKMLRSPIYLITAYCAALVVLPMVVASGWLMPMVLLTRILLCVPLFTGRVDGVKRAGDKGTFFGAIEVNTIAAPIVAFVAGQIYLMGLPTWEEISSALFEHPAVSSLGCDLIISCISAAIWLATQRNSAAGSKERQVAS